MPAGPPAALPAEPLRPFTGSPILSSVSAFRIASIPRVFDALHFPLRTSDGANFSNVSGKSMMTHPAGFAVHELRGVRVEVRLVRVPRDRGADRPAELLPLGDEERLQRRSERVVSGADVERCALAELRHRGTASTLLWSASDGYARKTSPLSFRSEICGALEVGETSTTLFGIVTDCAIGIVAPEAISPMITFALFTLMSFVAASTDADACVWPSSEPTSWTDALRQSRLLEGGVLQHDGLLHGPVEVRPYAARSPVNGSTSPMRSSNAQFRGAADREAVAPVAWPRSRQGRQPPRRRA